MSQDPKTGTKQQIFSNRKYCTRCSRKTQFSPKVHRGGDTGAASCRSEGRLPSRCSLDSDVALAKVQKHKQHNTLGVILVVHSGQYVGCVLITISTWHIIPKLGSIKQTFVVFSGFYGSGIQEHLSSWLICSPHLESLRVIVSTPGGAVVAQVWEWSMQFPDGSPTVRAAVDNGLQFLTLRTSAQGCGMSSWHRADFTQNEWFKRTRRKP